MVKRLDELNGFSGHPSTMGPEYSWEVAKPLPPKPNISPARAQQLDQAAKQVIQERAASRPSSPSNHLQSRTVQNTKFWTPTEGGGTPGGRKPTGTGGDSGNYGFALPRYTDTYRASEAYQAGDKFDPKQTLFRYDPETLNTIARQQHTDKTKPFIPPHDTKNPVYEGFPDRKGIDAMGRAWDHEARKGKGNERGRYLFDMRDHNKHIKNQVTAELSQGHAVALREVYSIPSTPTRVSSASISSWQDSPDQQGMIRVSRALGGGEQIIGDPKFFKFTKP